MRQKILVWLLDTHREMLVTISHAEDEHNQEYGTGDFYVAKMQFRANANKTFALYQVRLALLLTTYGQADEEIGVIMRSPIPFPDEQPTCQETQL